MMTLSVALSVQFRLSARGLNRFQRRLQGTPAMATIALGSWIAVRALIAT